MNTTIFVRILLNGVLLSFVWGNSHWSVALTLTLLSITTEFQNLTIGVLVKRMKNPLL